jgi:hypothetical protein
MADTYTWTVNQLERLVQTGEIQTVHYSVAARSEDEVYASSAYGSLGLDPADPDNMIPFADLTQELVIGWVQEALGGDEKVTEIQAALQAQIDEQRAPSKAAGVPWQ